MLILAVADGITDGSLHENTISEKLKYFEQKYDIKLLPSSDKRALAVSLYKLAENQMKRCPKEKSDKVGQIFPHILKGNPGEPSYRYKSFVRIPFEDTSIPVPAFYNAVLSSRYTNYHITQKNQACHGYPSFDFQRKTF